MARDEAAEFSDYLRKLGRKGGKARLKTMTPEQRIESARKAGLKSAEVRRRKSAAKKRGRSSP